MSKRFLSVNNYSEMTGIDRRTIRKRIEGLTAQRGPGKALLYDAFEVLPRLYQTMGTAADIERLMANETLLLERAKREKTELDVKRIRGEYISVDEIKREVGNEYSAVSQQLRGLGSKLAKSLAILMEPKEIQFRIEESINEILTELNADKKYEELANEINDIGETSEGSKEENVTPNTETKSS